MRATIEVLSEHGLEGTTVPRIAEAAGVAPASVYRRFPDKNALLRAAFLDVLERSAVANREHMTPERFAGKSLESILPALVTAIFRQYRSHPRLLRALVTFQDREGEEEFRQATSAIIAANIRQIASALRACLAGVSERETVFGLVTAIALVEMITLENSPIMTELLGEDDAAIQGDLAGLLRRYWG
jgi:AcrR family transcriptional regulator